MEPTKEQITSLLNEPRVYEVPKFQRPYKWGRANWSTLWDDLLRQRRTKRSSHFMGAIIVTEPTKTKTGVSRCWIIDGQQRLTTVATLLVAMRNRFVELNDETHATEVDDYLLNKRRISDSKHEHYVKLVLGKGDCDEFRRLCSSRTVSHAAKEAAPLLLCENFFRKKLQAYGKAEVLDLLHVLQDQFWFVQITLNRDDDASLVFLSLNAKGLELDEGDLLRTLFVVQLSLKHGPRELDELHETLWWPVEKKFDGAGRKRSEMFQFLRAQIQSKAGEVGKKAVYHKYSERIDELGVREVLSEVRSGADRFERLLRPKLEQDERLRFAFRNLGQKCVDTTTHYALLLALCERHEAGKISHADLDHCCLMVESFLVRRIVCSARKNALSALFPRLCKRLALDDPKNVIEWLFAKLARRRRGVGWPTDTEFGAAFKGEPQTGKTGIRHILASLELSLAGKESPTLADPKFTIEHIMPQKLTKEWRVELGGNWKRVHETWIDRIANLTLSKYNSEHSNKSFSKKKAYLAQRSKLELNADIARESRWAEAEMKARGERLFELAVRIWRGPSDAKWWSTPPSRPVRFVQE